MSALQHGPAGQGARALGGAVPAGGAHRRHGPAQPGPAGAARPLLAPGPGTDPPHPLPGPAEGQGCRHSGAGLRLPAAAAHLVKAKAMRLRMVKLRRVMVCGR